MTTTIGIGKSTGSSFDINPKESEYIIDHGLTCTECALTCRLPDDEITLSLGAHSYDEVVAAAIVRIRSLKHVVQDGLDCYVEPVFGPELFEQAPVKKRLDTFLKQIKTGVYEGPLGLYGIIDTAFNDEAAIIAVGSWILGRPLTLGTKPAAALVHSYVVTTDFSRDIEIRATSPESAYERVSSFLDDDEYVESITLNGVKIPYNVWSW